MNLHPDEEIFSQNARFLSANGEPFEVDRMEFVVGHLVDSKASFVHGAITNGRFRGVIRADGERYMVEPALVHFEQQQKFHSVMYKDSDVLHHKVISNRTCGAARHLAPMMYEEIHQQVKRQVEEEVKSRSRRQAVNRDKVECRINIAGDHTFSEHVRTIECKTLAFPDLSQY